VLLVERHHRLIAVRHGVAALVAVGVASPEVEVPLPLLFGAMPVVSCFALAELAAGRGVPGPPGLLCANASGVDSMNAIARLIAVSFMGEFPFADAIEGNLRKPPMFPVGSRQAPRISSTSSWQPAFSGRLPKQIGVADEKGATCFRPVITPAR
jgi:hypothetical protein